MAWVHTTLAHLGPVHLFLVVVFFLLVFSINGVVLGLFLIGLVFSQVSNRDDVVAISTMSRVFHFSG